MTTLGSIIGGEAGKSLKDHGIAEGTATAKAALFAEVNHLAPFSLNLCPHSGKVSKCRGVSWCTLGGVARCSCATARRDRWVGCACRGSSSGEKKENGRAWGHDNERVYSVC